jgi:hypothetical protein
MSCRRAKRGDLDRTAPDVAFYCVTDNRHFLGFVALLNSLRLLGHDEPVFLVDAGMTTEQRDTVSAHTTVLPALEGAPSILLKPFGPLEHPASVAILLDADIVVVRRLTSLVEAARDGKLVAFLNNEPNHERFFPEWSSALALPMLRPRPYVAAGQLFIPESLNQVVLAPWNDALQRIDVERTWAACGRLSDPFYFGDMDAFNAIVGAYLDADQIMALPHRLAPLPPFQGVRLVDKGRLDCRYDDGTHPFLLHHALAKPWLTATSSNVYSMLLPRLLLAPDVAVRLGPEQLPVRLREGWLAPPARAWANAQSLLYDRTRRQLGRFGIRTRLAGFRQSRAASRA